MSRNGRAYALAPEHQAWEEAYVADLRRIGCAVDHAWRWGARVFCVRFGDGAGWHTLSVPEQLALNRKIQRFVTWLIATRRLRPSAAYLVARRQHLGTLLARLEPAAHASFVATASEIGFGARATSHQWGALALVCAYTGVAPTAVQHAHLDAARTALVQAAIGQGRGSLRFLRTALFGVEATLFHAGVTEALPRRSSPTKAAEREAAWAALAVQAPTLVTTMRRYLQQLALSLRPGTVHNSEAVLREFARFLATEDPAVTTAAAIGRRHVEAYKRWLTARPAARGGTLHRHTIADRLGRLRNFFQRLIEWGDDDAPARVPLFAGDFPIPDEPLPRFLDDGAAAKLLVAARADPDPFVRLAVEFLARTGLRKGEFLALTVDAVVQIGSAYWLRVPVGKLHNDRYIPLHPHLKALLDTWLAARPEGLRSNLLFVERGRRLPVSRVDAAVRKVASAAGIGHVSPHQLRHTLATQAINRGMSLEALAALLGHRSLRMTLVYARIADRTVADEYFKVSEQVEALYDQPARPGPRGQPKHLPAQVEGSEMAKLRREMHRRMLGNGYCARPVELDCHFESICESCSFFVTTPEFTPILTKQRDDAQDKGQIGRQRIFDGLLARLQEDAS
jgi:site-specific recombinase XerD